MESIGLRLARLQCRRREAPEAAQMIFGVVRTENAENAIFVVSVTDSDGDGVLLAATHLTLFAIQ